MIEETNNDQGTDPGAQADGSMVVIAWPKASDPPPPWPPPPPPPWPPPPPPPPWPPPPPPDDPPPYPPNAEQGDMIYFDATAGEQEEGQWVILRHPIVPDLAFQTYDLRHNGVIPYWVETSGGTGGGWEEPAGTVGDMLYHNGTTWVKFNHAGEPAADEIYALSQSSTAAPTWKKLKKYPIDLCSGGTPTTFTLYGEP